MEFFAMFHRHESLIGIVFMVVLVLFRQDWGPFCFVAVACPCLTNNSDSVIPVVRNMCPSSLPIVKRFVISVSPSHGTNTLSRSESSSACVAHSVAALPSAVVFSKHQQSSSRTCQSLLPPRRRITTVSPSMTRTRLHGKQTPYGGSFTSSPSLPVLSLT